MASLARLPCPPSRDAATRNRQVPQSVRRLYEAFLERVRARRSALRLTHDDLAQRIGISTSQFANLERGYSMITVAKLFILAAVLKTSAAELVTLPPSRRRSKKKPSHA